MWAGLSHRWSLNGPLRMVQRRLNDIPAEVWRLNENVITKVFIKDKEVVNILLDPNFELADVEMRNNVFPKKTTTSKFDQFKKNN